MSEIFYNEEDFRIDITNRMIRTYITDAVWKYMQNKDFDRIRNEAYENFFKTVEKIVQSEELDNDKKVEKLLRLIDKYEIKLY
ncbi:MAG: hypothetical protein IJE10_08670 [Clostridia bacterium]|nr:hypothetical protein [Clostridia bacterium]